MRAKEYLRQYEYANRKAERLKAEYEAELELVDSVRSTLGGDGMPHGSGVSKTVEDRAIRLADKAMCWKVAQLDALEKRQEVFELIHSIDGVEGKVLYLRYVDIHKWEEICVLIPMSWTGVHKAHRRALQIVQTILDKRV
jgi:DNA-directed RNA polymerase specialized sigma24 family protein